MRTDVHTTDGRTDGRTDRHMDGQHENIIPPSGGVSKVVYNKGLMIPATTKSLKLSKVGADITLADRPFQRQTADGKRAPYRHG